MNTPVVYFHSCCLDHDTGPHPEAASRLVAIRRALEEDESFFRWREPRPSPTEVLEHVHQADYVEKVRRVAQKGGGHLDMDTVMSAGSYEAALVAAGAGMDAVDRALREGERAFLAVRPPGHHALAGRGMGFCLFNSIAVAGAYALSELGVERILVFDWDVHHGNGTQDAFYDDDRVLFVSAHLSPHYPGTGSVAEIGEGAGRGYTANVPLSRGMGDGAAYLLLEQLVGPLVRRFGPDLVLVSSGFDSQAGDPLGGLRFHPTTYRWMAARLCGLAEEVGAAGPVCFLEGGYDPENLATAVVATVRGLSGQEPDFAPDVSPDEEAAVQATLRQLEPFWGGLVGSE